MIERIIYSWSPETTTLMGISIVFGVIVGVVVVIALIMVMEKGSDKGKEKQQQQQLSPRKLLNPRRYRKESEERAVLRAKMMVASGAFSGPTRR
ncbi:MAG: hypothetical protein L3J57_14795 [Desulfuromusa sp.]|nr:hypothetical protein [Desulfuromusa sp.]